MVTEMSGARGGHREEMWTEVSKMVRERGGEKTGVVDRRGRQERWLEMVR